MVKRTREFFINNTINKRHKHGGMLATAPCCHVVVKDTWLWGILLFFSDFWSDLSDFSFISHSWAGRPHRLASALGYKTPQASLSRSAWDGTGNPSSGHQSTLRWTHSCSLAGVWRHKPRQRQSRRPGNSYYMVKTEHTGSIGLRAAILTCLGVWRGTARQFWLGTLRHLFFCLFSQTSLDLVVHTCLGTFLQSSLATSSHFLLSTVLHCILGFLSGTTRHTCSGSILHTGLLTFWQFSRPTWEQIWRGMLWQSCWGITLQLVPGMDLHTCLCFCWGTTRHLWPEAGWQFWRGSARQTRMVMGFWTSLQTSSGTLLHTSLGTLLHCSRGTCWHSSLQAVLHTGLLTVLQLHSCPVLSSASGQVWLRPWTTQRSSRVRGGKNRGKKQGKNFYAARFYKVLAATLFLRNVRYDDQLLEVNSLLCGSSHLHET